MSKQRQRDRAAREAAQAAEQQRRAAQAKDPRKAPAKAQAKDPHRAQQKAHRPTLHGRPARTPVYRQRRFPPLPWRFKLALVLGWLVAAVLILYLVPTWTGRVGFLVITTFALPLIVVLVRDPTRRTR